MNQFAKAMLSGAISAATCLVTALADEGVTAGEWSTCLLGFLSSVGAYYGVSRTVAADVNKG